MTYVDLGYNDLLKIPNTVDLADGITNANADQILGSGSVGFSQTSLNTLQTNQNMESKNYIPGISGWKIYGSGAAEFQLIASKGYIKVYSQDTEPSGGTYYQGDLWYDTNDSNKRYVYKGAVWVLDEGISKWSQIIDDGGKPDDNATVGAIWSGTGANLINIPTLLTAPTGTGLFTDNTHLGYYTASAWKTYIDNTGNLVLGDIAGGGIGLAWNQAAGTLNIKGSITMSGGSISWADVSAPSYSQVTGTKPPTDATNGATLGVNVAGGGSGANQISNSGYVTTIDGDSITTGTITVGSSSVGLTVNSGGDIVMNSQNSSSFSSILFRNGSAGWDMSYIGSGGGGYTSGDFLFEPVSTNQTFSIGSFMLTTEGIYTNLAVYGNAYISGILNANQVLIKTSGRLQIPVGTNLY